MYAHSQENLGIQWLDECTKEFSCVTCRNVLPNIHHQRASVSPIMLDNSCKSQLLLFKLTRIHLETTLKFNLTTKKSVYYVYLEITNEIFWHYSTVHDNSIDLLMAVIHTSHIGNSMASSTVQISCFPFHHYHHIFQITKTARVFISPY